MVHVCAAVVVRCIVPRRSSTLLPAARSSRLFSTIIGMSGCASGAVVPIGQAKAGRVDVGDGVSLWYREWGNPAGTPVVFVHGGPGQCVADYNDVNARFFDEALFRVVEVDQRGTGQSPPKLTRTPRPSQPPALGTYQRRRAAWPQRATYCTYWVHVPASGVPYAPRTGMRLRTAAPWRVKAPPRLFTPPPPQGTATGPSGTGGAKAGRGLATPRRRGR